MKNYIYLCLYTVIGAAIGTMSYKLFYLWFLLGLILGLIFIYKNKKMIDVVYTTYHKIYDDGSKTWFKFNKEEKLIESYQKYSDGSEVLIENDKENVVIHYKTSTGYEYSKEYDKKGNINSKIDKISFDENKKTIHCKDSIGYELCNEHKKLAESIKASVLKEENRK